MKYKAPVYERTDNIIHNVLESGTKQKFSSINKAKRASRMLQIKKDGALGRGCLRLVE